MADTISLDAAPINLSPKSINPRYGFLQDTVSGERVDVDDSMSISSVYSCVNVLSQAIASLPLELYKTERGTRSKAVRHALYNICKKRPNPEFTSFRWRQHVMVQVLLRGNSVSQVVRDGSGRVKALYPLLWENTTPRRRENGDLVYEYSKNTGSKRTVIVLNRDEVLHVRGISSTGGLVGMSVIESQREMLGTTKSIENHGAATFKNGASLSGVLSSEGVMSDAAYQRLRDGWSANYGGSSNAGKTPILEGGVTYVPIAMTNADAQFLESRRYQRGEIAAMFRVPLHLINDLERATFSNIEHQDLGFVKHTLLPWLINIEQELDFALLSISEQNRLSFKHNVSGLERGDFTSRTQGLAALVQSAIMTPNEARAKEELNDHEDGDTLLGNGSLTPVNLLGQQLQPEPESSDES